MKVLAAIVIPPNLSASGAVNAALSLSKSLTRHCQIDVALMSDHDGEERIGNLKLMKCRSRNLLAFTERWLSNKYRTLFYRSEISTLVNQYDLVHLHNPIPALELKRIAAACMAHNKPYVMTTHGFVEILGLQSAYQLSFLENLGGKYFLRNPVQYVIDHASKLCCLAPQDRQLLVDRGVPEDKLTIIPNGVEPSYFTEPSETLMASTCAKFNLPREKDPNVGVCFFVANHTRNKGLDILLDACLASTSPLQLIVGGKKRDFDYESYLSRAKPHQRILFTDALTDDEIRVFHRYADLFVFPSRADTLPLVVLEAMASGTAVLSTRVGGIPYQIDDSCGRLVDSENPQALCKAMEEMLSDREQLKAMGAAGRQKAITHFNWDHSADAMFEVYQQVLGLDHPTDNQVVPVKKVLV